MNTYKISKVVKKCYNDYEEVYFPELELTELVGFEFTSLKQICNKLNIDLQPECWWFPYGHELEVEYYELLDGTEAKREHFEIYSKNNDDIVLFKINLLIEFTDVFGNELSLSDKDKASDQLGIMSEMFKYDSSCEEEKEERIAYLNTLD